MSGLELGVLNYVQSVCARFIAASQFVESIETKRQSKLLLGRLGFHRKPPISGPAKTLYHSLISAKKTFEDLFNIHSSGPLLNDWTVNYDKDIEPLLKELSKFHQDITEKMIRPLETALSSKNERDAMTDEKYIQMDQTVKELVTRAREIVTEHLSGVVGGSLEAS